MAAIHVLVDMESVIEAISALVAHATTITTQAQNFAIATGIYEIVIFTASTIIMIQDQLKVEYVIENMIK